MYHLFRGTAQKEAAECPGKEYETKMNARLGKGSVPVRVAARVYGKDPAWVRAGIVAGWLPIGYAVRNGVRVTSVQEIGCKKGRINYYISPVLLYEQTGYEWRGKDAAH